MNMNEIQNCKQLLTGQTSNSLTERQVNEVIKILKISDIKR